MSILTEFDKQFLDILNGKNQRFSMTKTNYGWLCKLTGEDLEGIGFTLTFEDATEIAEDILRNCPCESD